MAKKNRVSRVHLFTLPTHGPVHYPIVSSANDEKPSTVLATTQHQGEKTMRKAIFAALAVLGLSLATAAVASAANANSYLFPPNQNEGSNS